MTLVCQYILNWFLSRFGIFAILSDLPADPEMNWKNEYLKEIYWREWFGVVKMSINVPEIYEETHQIESNSDTISVPLNGIPKVMGIRKGSNPSRSYFVGTKTRWIEKRQNVLQSERRGKEKPGVGKMKPKYFQDNFERDFVCINIRGKKFLVLRENLSRFPDTRLAKLVGGGKVGMLSFYLF